MPVYLRVLMFLFKALLYVLVSYIATGLECGDITNGNVEFTCFSYIRCVGGVATMVNCTYEEAYNRDTGACENRNSVPPPCNIDRDCTLVDNGRYADLESNCTSFYTCMNNAYFGHNFCSTGLVFNAGRQQCDWPRNVLPPCGQAPTVG